jgi:DNA-binding IclR family transcriptional regulator
MMSVAARAGEPVKDEAVPALLRGLTILWTLAEAGSGMRLTDLAERLDLPKSSVHLLLGTLTRTGWVERDPTTRTFALGLRAWEVGRAYLRGNDLAERAQPYMDQVRDQLNETVRLAVLRGTECVYIAKSDGGQALVLDSQVGARLPAHATGIGKVLLADLPPDELRRRYHNEDFPAFTPRTIVSLPDLETALAVVRQRGWAEDHEEYVIGVRCVAIPVRDHTTAVVAGLSVSVPAIRFDRQLRRRALDLLGQAARELSRVLGSPSAPSSMPSTRRAGTPRGDRARDDRTRGDAR